MKSTPNPELDNPQLLGRKKPELEKDDDPLQFPGDLRPEWVKDDIEIADRKPDLAEIEEDPSALE